MSGQLTQRIDDLAAEFAELEPRERLELLLEFSEKLPPLPPEFAEQRDQQLGRVQECQTPVYLWTDLVDGRVRIVADVAPEAPTVKGFVSILVELFSGVSPDEVLTAPGDLVQRFGLVDALGMVRMRGLQAIAHHIRRKVAAQMST
ncbi:MAG: SufE family protein [Planctomycetota bacterium]|nr:MAG: SufE family protein [Planctomycetota bacterium]